MTIRSIKIRASHRCPMNDENTMMTSNRTARNKHEKKSIKHFKNEQWTLVLTCDSAKGLKVEREELDGCMFKVPGETRGSTQE